ncbi:hypothetical protein AX15_005345 [Amanita polypyramis BW_CC]|nr:hypothetical protein AX15_005345 [Amanita polypyramis BW_CC]
MADRQCSTPQLSSLNYYHHNTADRFMSGLPNLDLRIYFGDSLTYKQVSIPRRWTIGAVRDKAITEMESHLKLRNPQPNTTPAADQVQIFRGHRLNNLTLLRDLNKTQTSSSVLALIPPPPKFSISTAFDKLIDAKLEKVKSEHP